MKSFLSLLILFSAYSFAQENMMFLTSKDEKSLVTIAEGMRLRVQLRDFSYESGKFQYQTDSTFLLGENCVNKNQITHLKVIDIRRTVAGGVFICMAIGAVIAGIYGMSNAENLGDGLASAGLVFISPFPLTIGLALSLIYKEYDLIDDWDISLE